MTYSRHNMFTPGSDEIERLLHHMPAVVGSAENEWAAGFAKSIIVQSRRRGWKPSPKQLHVMRSLVTDLFTHADNLEGDLVLIED